MKRASQRSKGSWLLGRFGRLRRLRLWLHRASRLSALLVMSACALAPACPVFGQDEDLVRVSQLSSMTGQRAQVKGRTGIIVEEEDAAGPHVFTLRDDYGDQVYVRTELDYPIMGATYVIEGVPEVDPDTGTLYLEEQRRRRAHPVTPGWLLPTLGAVVGAVAVGGILVAILMRRKVVRAKLAPAWGYVEVVAGPDQGKSFALRGEETVVGRAQDPSVAVSVALDQHVSRDHGKIVRRGNEISYQDTNSTGGSWVDEEWVGPGESVLVRSGTLLRLGSRTILRLGLPTADSKTRGPEGSESSDWGEAPTEHGGGPITGAEQGE